MVALTIKRVKTTKHKGAERGLTKDKLNQIGTKISKMKQRERERLCITLKRLGSQGIIMMHNCSVTASR